MNKFKNFVFRPQRSGIRKALGKLEAEIMELIWQRPVGEGISVRDIYEILHTRRSLAYTTVMTTMSRLAKKGLLSIEKVNQTYIYRALLTKKEFTDSLVGWLLDSLFLDLSGAALSYFLSSADAADREELERILREVERQRREGKV
ncbi:MAG: BlaI/MecI/CopY family transcriptional regulator [Chloroflexota bacterium]